MTIGIFILCILILSFNVPLFYDIKNNKMEEFGNDFYQSFMVVIDVIAFMSYIIPIIAKYWNTPLF